MSAPASPTHPAVADGSGAMFDRIARRYDLLNRLMSFGIDRRWRRRTIAALEVSGDRPRAVLDLATGTADLAIAAARAGAAVRVTGIDPSEAMLAVGRRKVDRAGLSDRIALAAGDAQALQLEDRSFDGVCMGFGIRNVPDRPRALREMARVTRPGGRVAILELTDPPSGWMGGLARFHVHWLVPRLGALLSGAREYRYLEQSIAAFPAPDAFAAMMGEAGIEVERIQRFAFGACTLFVGRPRS